MYGELHWHHTVPEIKFTIINEEEMLDYWINNRQKREDGAYILPPMHIKQERESDRCVWKVSDTAFEGSIELKPNEIERMCEFDSILPDKRMIYSPVMTMTKKQQRENPLAVKEFEDVMARHVYQQLMQHVFMHCKEESLLKYRKQEQ